ncbi:MAG: histidine phosphatase family protein [Akkermansiaceae bacterium]|nr:histidine phosphatase family protein [Armatimonadota bacterium]
MDKTVYLIRHCETSGQAPDAPLTPKGIEQAEALGEWLFEKSIGRIVSSPYVRACQSVAPLADRLGLPLETDERLIERALSGTSLPDWKDRLAASFTDPDQCLPGGESSRAAMARGVAAIRDALSHPATTTVIVTHGNLLALLLKHFDDAVGFAEWERLTNPDVYRVRYVGGATHVERLVQEMPTRRSDTVR